MYWLSVLLTLTDPSGLGKVEQNRSLERRLVRAQQRWKSSPQNCLPLFLVPWHRRLASKQSCGSDLAKRGTLKGHCQESTLSAAISRRLRPDLYSTRPDSSKLDGTYIKTREARVIFMSIHIIRPMRHWKQSRTLRPAPLF